MGVLELLLFLFRFYIPACFLILCFVAKFKYPKYSPLTHWVSNLGIKKYPSHSIFDWVLRLLTILSVPLIPHLIYTLPAHPLSSFFIVSLVSADVSVFAVTFFPMDSRPYAHLRVAKWLFLSLLASATSCLIVFNLLLVSPTVTLSTAVLLTLMVVFYVSTRLLTSRYPGMHLNLVEIRSHEKSFLIRQNAFLEWITLVAGFAWIFFLSF